MRSFARLLQHTPLIKFVGGPHKFSMKPHPSAPNGLVPGSTGLASSSAGGSLWKSGIEPRDGEVFSRAELSPRFRYKPIKDFEIDQLISGGAELFATIAEGFATMNHDPYAWGRPDDAVYGAYNHQIASASSHGSAQAESNFPKMNTQQPIITGTSVNSIKFKDGIIIAADNVGSYGSLLRFNNIERIVKVGKETVVGVSGDISDFQQIQRMLDDLEISEEVYDNDGGHNLRAPNVHEYLTRVLYNRRSKMDPLWNAVVVAGFNDDRTPFLRYVDLLGVTYGLSAICTGFGAHLAIPLLRQLVPQDDDYKQVTEEQARVAIINCMRVLFYRDARSSDKFTLVTLKDNQAPRFEKDLRCENQSWRFAKDLVGYGNKQQ